MKTVSHKVAAITLSILLSQFYILHESLCSQSIDDKGAAIQVAISLVGNGVESSEKSQSVLIKNAQTMTYVDTSTPFLHDSLNGVASWKCDMEFHLLKEIAQARANEVLDLSGEIWLDSTSGKLLRVNLRSEGSDGVSYRLPTAKEAEYQLKMGGEKYLGLPDMTPTLTLSDVIDRYSDDIVGYKELIIQYILYSAPRADTTPVWVIYLRDDVPQDLPGMEGASPYCRMSWRVVVNAETGLSYGKSNIPHPMITDEGLDAESRSDH